MVHLSSGDMELLEPTRPNQEWIGGTSLTKIRVDRCSHFRFPSDFSTKILSMFLLKMDDYEWVCTELL